MGKDREKIEFLARRVTVVRAGKKLWDKRRTMSPENSHICGKDFGVKFLGVESFEGGGCRVNKGFRFQNVFCRKIRRKSALRSGILFCKYRNHAQT